MNNQDNTKDQPAQAPIEDGGSAPCGSCLGSGMVDSGGQNPDGSWIEIPCNYCAPAPPDPEYIPSKPGVEAAAPLDAQDGLDLAAVEAALAKVTQVPRDYWPEDREVAIGVLVDFIRPALSRLSSPWMADSRPLLAEIEKLAGERDALRKALSGLLQRAEREIADPVDVWEIQNARATLSPTPSPKEAQNG